VRYTCGSVPNLEGVRAVGAKVVAGASSSPEANQRLGLTHIARNTHDTVPCEPSI